MHPFKYLAGVAVVSVFVGWALKHHTPSSAPAPAVAVPGTAVPTSDDPCQGFKDPKKFASCVEPAIAQLVIAVEQDPLSDEDGDGQLYVLISISGEVISLTREEFLNSPSMVELFTMLNATKRVQLIPFNPGHASPSSCPGDTVI